MWRLVGRVMRWLSTRLHVVTKIGEPSATGIGIFQQLGTEVAFGSYNAGEVWRWAVTRSPDWNFVAAQQACLVA